MYAVGSPAQNIDVVQELLDKGADVNVATLTGISPVLLAAEKGHSAIVQKLLIHDANIFSKGGEDMNSALHVACLAGDAKTVQTLLDHCKGKLSDKQTQDFLHITNKQS